MNQSHNSKIKLEEEINKIKLEIAYKYNKYYKFAIKSASTNFKIQSSCALVNISIPLIAYSNSGSLISLFTLFLSIIPIFFTYKSIERKNGYLKSLAGNNMSVKEVKKFINSDEFIMYVELAKELDNVWGNKDEPKKYYNSNR